MTLQLPPEELLKLADALPFRELGLGVEGSLF